MSEAAESATSVRERLTLLTGRVRELLGRDDDTTRWFAMWTPVFMAVMRLGGTLSKLAIRLKDVALSTEPVPPMDEDVQARLVEDLRGIGDEFPDVAEVLFGLGHIDSLIDAVLADDGARRAAASLLAALSGMVDRLVGSLVDIALGEKESEYGPERLIAILERYEEVAERLLERWLMPAVAMTMSEAEDVSKR